MILRIVKMKFRPECCDEFQALFNQYHLQISAFENCLGVELWRDKKDPSVFFTYSQWESEEDLNKYRNSELFKMVWGKTRALFAEKAEAWSVSKLR